MTTVYMVEDLSGLLEDSETMLFLKEHDARATFAEISEELNILIDDNKDYIKYDEDPDSYYLVTPDSVWVSGELTGLADFLVRIHDEEI